MAQAQSIDPARVHRAGKAQVEQLLADISLISSRLKAGIAGGQTDSGLPTAALRVLELLMNRGPQTVPQIARVRSSSRQNIQIIANRLLADDCIALTPNPAHRRSSLLSITATGLERLRSTPDPLGPIVERLISELSEPEIASGTRIVERLKDLLIGERAVPEIDNSKPSRREDKVVEESDNELPVNLL